MNTIDAIQKRWGCRKYSDDPINKEELGTVLDAGRYAPSSGNLQDRSFIIIKDSKLKADIAQAAGNQTWIQTAPVLIVVVAENEKVGKFFGPRGDKIYSIQDTSFAVQNMLLAATELGIGNALVVGFNEEKLNQILKISPPAQPHAIITLGKPLEQAKTSSKYPLEKFVYFEKHKNKIADMDVTFGDLKKAKEQININAEKAKNAGKGLIEKIKSLFKRKKQEPLGEDTFMREKDENPFEMPKPVEKDSIPRLLPRK
ncbi:MAG: nitroreductase family protein [Nanoarchaeota archaeon]